MHRFAVAPLSTSLKVMSALSLVVLVGVPWLVKRAAKRAVVMLLPARIVVVTPEDPDAFIRALRDVFPSCKEFS